MSVSPLALVPGFVDYWGSPSARADVFLGPVEGSPCHAPRLAIIPADERQVVPSGGKINYNFTLVPGSFILGLFVGPALSSAVQITDVATGHRWFQEPLSVATLRTAGADVGIMDPFTLLPSPYPVVGEGLFQLEVWDAPGTRFYMVLMVAEVTGCPVR